MSAASLPSATYFSPTVLNVCGATLKAIFYNQLIASTSLMLAQTSSIAYAEVCPSSNIDLIPASPSTSYSPIHDPLDHESNTISSILSKPTVNIILKRAKICPDFKDDADQSACCHSQIKQGAYYCCTEEHRARLQWEIDKEIWRQYIESHLFGIVISSITCVVIMFILASLICKRFACCPLYRHRTPMQPTICASHQNNRRYSFVYGRHHLRPLVSSAYSSMTTTNSMNFGPHKPAVVHKPLAPYEAPPPYDFAIKHSSQLHNPDSSLGSVGPPSIRPLNDNQRSNDWNYLLENEVNNANVLSNNSTGSSKDIIRNTYQSNGEPQPNSTKLLQDKKEQLRESKYKRTTETNVVGSD